MSKPVVSKKLGNIVTDEAFGQEQLRQIKLQNKLQEQIIHEKEVCILGSKIEHARRNIDALTHINTDGSCKDIKDLVIETMKKNIEILGEVKDIK